MSNLDKCQNCGECVPCEVLKIKEGFCMNCHIDKHFGNMKSFNNKVCFGTGYCECKAPPHHCNYCKTKLVPIGGSRFNGAHHDDWESRLYHKKCWKICNS